MQKDGYKPWLGQRRPLFLCSEANLLQFLFSFEFFFVLGSNKLGLFFFFSFFSLFTFRWARCYLWMQSHSLSLSLTLCMPLQHGQLVNLVALHRTIQHPPVCVCTLVWDDMREWHTKGVQAFVIFSCYCHLVGWCSCNKINKNQFPES